MAEATKGPTFKEYYGQTFMEAVEKMDPKEVIKRPEVKALWEGKGITWLLSYRRGHRFARGIDFPPCDFFAYKTTKEAVPLDEVETALVCWAGVGTTGLLLIDWSTRSPIGFKSFERRAIPDGGSGIWGHLMFNNDDGLFLYTPHVPTKMVEIEKQEDMEIIFRAFKEGITRIGEPVRAGGKVPLALFDFIEKVVFQPGQTQFMPACDTVMILVHFLVAMFNAREPRERHQPIDELTGKLMYAKHWVDDGYLQGIKAPWRTLEDKALATGGTLCGMLIHNIDLMAAAMGLGTYKFSGVNLPMLLGSTPAMKGLGLRFVSDKQGFTYPVGIDGLFGAHVPPVFPIDEAADGYYEACWGSSGRMRPWVKEGDEVIYQGYSPKPRAVHRPWKDSEAWLQVVNQYPEEEPGMGQFTKESRQIIKEIFHYLYDNYGHVPRNIDPILVPHLTQVHHVPVDFYDRYFREGAISPEQRRHLKVWHGLHEE